MLDIGLVVCANYSCIAIACNSLEQKQSQTSA